MFQLRSIAKKGPTWTSTHSSLMSQAKSTASCIPTSCWRCLWQRAFGTPFVPRPCKFATSKTCSPSSPRRSMLAASIPSRRSRRSWCPPRAASARATSPALQPQSPRAARVLCSGCGLWRLSAPRRHSSNRPWRRSSRFAAKTANFAAARLITSSRVWASAGWAWCSPCCLSCASRSASTACSRSMLRAR